VRSGERQGERPCGLHAVSRGARQAAPRGGLRAGPRGKLLRVPGSSPRDPACSSVRGPVCSPSRGSDCGCLCGLACSFFFFPLGGPLAVTFEAPLAPPLQPFSRRRLQRSPRPRLHAPLAFPRGVMFGAFVFAAPAGLCVGPRRILTTTWPQYRCKWCCEGNAGEAARKAARWCRKGDCQQAASGAAMGREYS
jgi:hypothetical protein